MRKFVFWLVLLCVVLSIPVNTLFAQSDAVRAVVVNEFANIRIVPAIGAEVIATVPAGFLFERINGRSPDNEWLRIDFNGQEGWVNRAPLTLLSGDLSTLPVADPRTIPFGGFEAPRSGLSSATSDIQVYLPTSGLRVRAGPSTGYPVLAEMPRFSQAPAFGRTESNAWIQVNFEGTLGWIANQFVQLSVGIQELPIGGIIAEAQQPSEAVAQDYFNTLRLLLARIDLAQPSLDAVRLAWTDAALAGRVFCDPYPARPSDYNIPNDLLAAYFGILSPIINEFNDAMFNVRKAIDLLIQACNQPGTGNPVGQATVIGALDTIALADRQFANLRRRLTELIPPLLEPGENECLFTFQEQSEILPVIPIGNIVIDSFDPRNIVTGYCFDAVAGQSLLFETYQRPTSNIIHFLSVSLLDNPTNFLAVGRGIAEAPRLGVGPLLIQETGRYLLVLSNIGDPAVPPNGEFAVLISQITGVTQQFLNYDATTDQFFVSAPVAPVQQPQPTLPGGPPVQATSQPPPFLPTSSGPPFAGTSNETPAAPAGPVCPGLSLTCEQLTSCDQANACLTAGNFSLDSDQDGIPCENLCGG